MAFNLPVEVEPFVRRAPANTILDTEESEISSSPGSKWVGFGLNFSLDSCSDSVIKNVEVCVGDEEFDAASSFGTSDPFVPWRAQWAATCNMAQLLQPGQAQEFLAKIRNTHVDSLHKELASGFWDRVLVNVPAGNVINPSPAAALKVVPAIASLIQMLSQNGSGSEGVLHMSPLVATLAVAENILYRSGRFLRTVVGDHLVIADGGYNGSGPSGVAATASTQWVYATGTVRHKITDSVFPAGFDLKDYFHRSSNTLFVPVETFMVAYFDPCQWFAVNVDLF